MIKQNGIGKPIVVEGLQALLRSIRKSKNVSALEMAALLRMPSMTYWRAEGGRPIVIPTALLIVRRLSRWRLAPTQTEKLAAIKERILQ